MAVFFNGQLLVTPTVSSFVDDTAMANRNLTVGNVLALVGPSTGGAPNTPLAFGSPQEARSALRSGALCDAAVKAFDASAQLNAPSRVVAVRVNPAVAASVALKASGVDVLTLAATDYGAWTNQLKVKVEAGTEKGLKLSTQFGADYYTADNIYRDALSVVYDGAEATATVSVTNSAVTLSAPAGSVVATIDLNDFDTIAKLVDRINVVSGWEAEVLDGNDEKPALSGLDSVTAASAKTTARTLTANLQAAVDWFNGAGEGYMTATREAGAGTAPDAVAWTYLTGGSDGTITQTQWANALVALQTEDVQWVVPLTSDAAVHAAVDAHVHYMSTVARMERRAFVGGATAQTIDEAIAAAKALNSDRTAQVYPGHYDYAADGTRELRPSYMTAAVVAAGFAGTDPGTALTNKSLKIRGVEAQLRNPIDTDKLINGGVLCVEETPTGYKVVKSISTWLVNDNYNRVEVSTGFAVDFVARNVRQAVEQYKGEKGSPRTLSLIASAVDSALFELARPEPAGPAVIVGDEDSPAYRNIQVSLSGDVVRVEFECSPVIPINYILVTIHAVPYSGTITA